MQRIVILVSGRGSNAQAILQACTAEGWPARVVAVVSNRPGAAALEAATSSGASVFGKMCLVISHICEALTVRAASI